MMEIFVCGRSSFAGNGACHAGHEALKALITSRNRRAEEETAAEQEEK